MIQIIRDFARGQRGNVAIMFSLTLLPMIGMVGLGIDISRTIAARTSLQAAADAAALAAATTTLNTLQSSNSQMNTQAQALSNGQAAGTNVFNANAARVVQWTGQTITPTVNVPAPVNNVVTATVTYNTPVPTVFGRMFKVNQFNVSGSAKSSLSLPSYINITVLIDNSESMGFAASQTDITNFEKLTSSAVSGSCAFGCHAVQANQYGKTDYEDLAHNNNITLRTDVINTGMQNMIQSASNLGYTNPLVSFTLYTFNKSLSSPLGNLKQSTNYSSLITAAKTIDIDQNPSSSSPSETAETSIIANFAASVPASGDGSTAAKAKQFVFLMTDGVDDFPATSSSQCQKTSYWNKTYQACFQPANCTALKNNTSATIGVIYTTYIDEPGIGLWDATIQPIDPKSPAAVIGSAMQSCASDPNAWYFQATQASDINNAINALFSKAVSSSILIQ